MSKNKFYNLMVWVIPGVSYIILQYIGKFYHPLYNTLSNGLTPVILGLMMMFAYLGTHSVGAELRIEAIKTDVPFFDVIKDVYMKMFFRIVLTGAHCFILYKILRFIIKSHCVQRYGIGVCIP
jgi:hypothetical protein